MKTIREIVKSSLARQGVDRYFASIFNDRLKDGTRSVKAWGTSATVHKKVAIALRRHGYKVKLVPADMPWWGKGEAGARLHVRRG